MRRRPIERLFHLTAAENWPSIQRDGLLSTRALLDRSGVVGELRAAVERHRPEAIRLQDGALIGDQWCQPPHALERCLLDGLTPQDWYDRLNGFVFLWPDAGRAARHVNTYRGRNQLLLIFDAEGLLGANGGHAWVSGFNTGYALRRAKPRGRDAFTRYAEWRETGGAVVEVVIEGAVPDAMAHLVEARHLAG